MLNNLVVPILAALLLQACVAVPLIAVGVAVVDDACQRCLPRPR